MVNKETTSILSLITAAFLFSLYGVYARWMGESFGPFFQAWSRSIITILIFVYFAFKQKISFKINKKDVIWFIVIGLCAALIHFPFYLAANHMPLGAMLFLFYASSTISSYILGIIIFKETLTPIKISALILAMTGLVIIYWGQINISQNVYILFAILAGTFFSGYSVLNKKISKDYPAILINITNHGLVIVVNLLLGLYFQETINLNFSSFAWFINILFALSYIGTGLLIIYGFKHIEVQKGSIILLSELLFVIIVSYIFFKEIPSITAVMGGLFIAMAVFLPNWKQISGRKSN